jgi:hypothetical protein
VSSHSDLDIQLGTPSSLGTGMAIQTSLSLHLHLHRHQHHPTHPPPDSRTLPPDDRAYPYFRIARVDGLLAHRPGRAAPYVPRLLHSCAPIPPTNGTSTHVMLHVTLCYLMCDPSFRRYCNEPILERHRHRLRHGAPIVPLNGVRAGRRVGGGRMRQSGCK